MASTSSSSALSFVPTRSPLVSTASPPRRPAMDPSTTSKPPQSFPTRPLPPRRPRPNFRSRPYQPRATDMSAIKPDSTHKGTVYKLTSYGAFVKLECGVSGLVHISEIARGFVSDVSEHVKIGQSVEVMVLSVDEVKNRVSLSMKRVSAGSVKDHYERVILLGGDWGHPWGDDTDYIDLGEREEGRQVWEPDLEIFREFAERDSSLETSDLNHNSDSDAQSRALSNDDE